VSTGCCSGSRIAIRKFICLESDEALLYIRMERTTN
jgi:hypothetical protein